MTVDRFIRSVTTYQTGDNGYCRLASISTEKNRVIYVIGFWYEIIKNNGKEMVLSAQLNTNTKKSYRNTFFIGEISNLEFFVDDLRLKAQDHIWAYCHSD